MALEDRRDIVRSKLAVELRTIDPDNGGEGSNCARSVQKFVLNRLLKTRCVYNSKIHTHTQNIEIIAIIFALCSRSKGPECHN